MQRPDDTDPPVDPEHEYRLLRSICSEQGSFSLTFALFVDQAVRDGLVARLHNDLARLGIDPVTVDVGAIADGRGLFDVLQDLHRASGTTAFIVTGIDAHVRQDGRWIGQDRDFLATTNLQRELLRDRIAGPVVIWCSPFALNAISTRAPDLWHWRSGLCNFSTERQETLERLWRALPAPVDNVWQEGVEDRRARLAQLESMLRELDDAGLDSRRDRDRAATLLTQIGEIEDSLGHPADAERHLRLAVSLFESLDDVHGRAVTMGQIADILEQRGDLDEALRIRTEDELPVYDALGDRHARAVAMGKIADILFQRGDLDEALRIRTEDELPVYDALGDRRARAVAMGRIADILQQRGDLDEALRIRTEEQLPVYDALGDRRARAVAMGRIADILQQRGDVDEALRIRTEEELPVYDALGDRRSRAVTMAKIADIHASRSRAGEALALLHQAAQIFHDMGLERELRLTEERMAWITATTDSGGAAL